MKQKNILTTERLRIRELSAADAPFIVQLLNTPGWLRFVGDRNVHSIADAEKYLQNGAMKSYAENGFGLWHVGLRRGGTSAGMCGLIRRPGLEDVDLGFALLPEFEGQGFALEAAAAVLRLGLKKLGLKRIVAITDLDNQASVKLLLKIGLRFEKAVRLSLEEKPLLFLATKSLGEMLEEEAIAALTSEFFSLFNNLGDAKPDLTRIHDLFIPQGIVIKNVGGQTEVSGLQEFIAPRQELLAGGKLRGFSEAEILGRTEIFGSIAQRFCLYRKSGALDGVPFEQVGMKTIQFVRTSAGWKMSALAWDDAD